ncbi:hypothetical protein BDV59DRAFT_204750 [Aspergillus ambiguus]|uniref:uncharacterized protein n=1 Tax=Aspergillus ambiguus TaxID=176160 RepID=UPI003CCDFE91
MSSNNKNTAAESEINPADVKFIIECLKNMGEDKIVDLAKVGAALEYTNVASVGNKFRAVRKRYGFHNLEGKASNSMAKSTPNSAEEDAGNAPEEDQDPKPKRKRTTKAKGSKAVAAKVTAKEE